VALLVGELHIQPSEIMEFDDVDFKFWYERLEDYNEWTNKK